MPLFGKKKEKIDKNATFLDLKASIKQIDVSIKKEWLEKEWRFKENASNVKVYTGRTYPARECIYAITLQDGRKIVGPLSALVYVQGEQERTGTKYILHKRQKGPIGSELNSLVYVTSVQLGQEAHDAGKNRIENKSVAPAQSASK